MRALRLIAAFLALALSPQIWPAWAASTGAFSVSCGSAAAGSDATCSVTRTSGGKGVYVQFVTSDGTAKAGTDYSAVSQLLYFKSSQVAQSVAIHTAVNPNATGTLTFSASIAASSVVARATASIVEPVPAPAPVIWTKCADENGTCTISGTASVRYGSGTTWLTQLVTGSISCSNSVFGDPLPGVVKECDTDGTAVVPAPAPTPAPTGSWVATTAPLAVGGYAFLKNQGPCCNGLIVKIVDGGMTNDADPALRQHWWTYVYYADPSGNFPASNPYWATAWMTGNDASLQGVAAQ